MSENTNETIEKEVELDVVTMLDMICGPSDAPGQSSKCITNVSNVIYENYDFYNGQYLSTVEGTPIIKIFNLGEFIEINLDFLDETSQDLRRFINVYNEYTEQYSESNTNGGFHVIHSLNCVPIAFPNIILGAANPIFWAFQANYPGGPVTTLKVLFKSEDITFGTTSMDIKKITDEVNAELDRKINQAKRENHDLEYQLKEMEAEAMREAENDEDE